MFRFSSLKLHFSFLNDNTLTMHFFQVALLGAFTAQAAAAPFSSKHVVHERQDYIPKAWIKRSRVDAAVELPVRIGMTQSNLAKGHDLLMEV